MVIPNRLDEALRQAKEELKKAGKDNYALEAERMMMKITGLSRVQLFLQTDRILSETELDELGLFLSQRINHRPLQYILGETEFMGLPFLVGEGVLIPRADTEILVETVLEQAKKDGMTTILDMCTGSGCIPIALAHYGGLRTIGADISKDALGFARENAMKNNADVLLIESDLFSALPREFFGTLDGVVSNPPYIEREVVRGLMPEVREFEPMNALDGGEDGLDFYKQIVLESKDWLKDKGWLFFEIGYNQGEAVLGFLEDAGFEACAVKKDLAGLDRVVCGRKR